MRQKKMIFLNDRKLFSSRMLNGLLQDPESGSINCNSHRYVMSSEGTLFTQDPGPLAPSSYRVITFPPRSTHRSIFIMHYTPTDGVNAAVNATTEAAASESQQQICDECLNTFISIHSLRKGSLPMEIN